MSNKVIICGVNTATLPMLKNKQINELMQKVKSGDKEARHEFIIGNMRLVLSVVQRFMNRKENIDDIFQVGCIGLIKAMENFNTELNVRFSTYAVPMIIGEIRRFLRDNSSVRVSRSMRDTAYKALKSRERLLASSENEPTIEDIAKDIELTYKEVACSLDAISEPLSLFDPVYHDGGEAVKLMDQISDNKNTSEHWLEGVVLNNALVKLNRREKEILFLRYYDGKTQIEVSDEVGISQAQVSRLEKNAIDHIRHLMDG